MGNVDDKMVGEMRRIIILPATRRCAGYTISSAMSRHQAAAAAEQDRRTEPARDQQSSRPDDFMPETFHLLQHTTRGFNWRTATVVLCEMPESEEPSGEMKVDAARAKVLLENLGQVVARVDAVRGSRPVCIASKLDLEMHWVAN